MNTEQLNQLLNKIKENKADDLENFWYTGIRFEEKVRQVGEIITDFSKHNVDREDIREFPEFGTEEYEEMKALEGVSAWHLDYFEFDADQKRYASHCYLLASDNAIVDIDGDLELDENELVMQDAEIIAQLF